MENDKGILVSSLIIGIDFGLTNSCVAYIKNGKVEFIEDEKYGTYLIPSVVSFHDEKNILVGTAAKISTFTYKTETIYETQRLIGRSFDDPEVQDEIRKLPFVVKNWRNRPKIVIRNRVWDEEFFVEEISKFVLEYLVNTAQKHLQMTITEAVITVPAYFGNEQRAATKQAAASAGIKIAHFINEPTAAALAFQFANSSKFDGNLLIYYFAGKTFDVCVVHTKNKHCEVLAVDGDCHLGGIDIDLNLVNFFKTDILLKHGLKIKENDSQSYRRLKNFAKGARKCLSRCPCYTSELILCEPKINYKIKITRQQFENLNEHLFRKTINLAETCVANAKLRKDQIDQIILVGGNSRIPMIRKMLKESFGDKINSSIDPDPDQIIAYGAAVYASMLSGKLKEITFRDVLTLSLGTDVIGNKMSNIIDRNTSLPCEKRKRYATTYDNQTEMTIKVYQGERVLASQNILLGEVCIYNLTEAPEGEVTVEVKFSVNEEGMLKVAAKELSTDNFSNLDIDMKRTLPSNTEIGQKIKEAEAARESDETQVRFANKKTEFENFCKTLEDAASYLEANRANSTYRQIESGRSTVQNLCAEQIGEVDEIMKQLSQLFNSL